MSNFWDCIMDAANETESGIPGPTSVPTISEFIRWGNKGQDLLALHTGFLQQLISFATIGRQMPYILPSNVVKPMNVEWVMGTQSKYLLKFMDWIEFRRNQTFGFTTGLPALYSVQTIPGALMLWIYPPRAGNAVNTNLSADISASALTIPVLTTSGMSNFGRVQIDGEKIDYVNTDATNLYCNAGGRGAENTVASTHNGSSSPATVTFMDLLVACTMRYLTQPLTIYTVGQGTFTNGSPTIVAGTAGNAPYWAGNVSPNMQIGTGTNPSKWYNISAVGSNLTVGANFGEATYTGSYVISSTLDFKQEYADALTLYMIYRTLKRKEMELPANMKQQELIGMIGDIRREQVDPVDSEYGGMHDSLLYDN